MQPQQLFAKSASAKADAVELVQHVVDVEHCVRRMFAPDKRFFRAWTRFFKVAHADHAKLVANLRVAALLHDIGKANAHFQQALTGERSGQAIRHEHFSALIIQCPAVREWLSASAIVDVDVVSAAVLSHHLKASDADDEWRWCVSRDARSVETFFSHTALKSVWERVADVAGLTGVPVLPDKAWVEGAAPWADYLRAGFTSARSAKRLWSHDAAKRALMLATKAGLIAADAVGSALVREKRNIDVWIDDVVHAEPLSEAAIADAVITPRIRQLSRPDKPFVFHRFQELAATQGDRALLLAACGTGKTLAAWRWAARQASSREFGRVIFLYPTRGTATEGFRDYVGWAPEADAALLHGTARFELDAIAENPNDATRGKVYDEAEQRLFAMRLWSKRFFSATVDQFLGFIENQYNGMCLLPALADAVVIVDEVHSFDKRLFENLVSALSHFDVPVLCMTATLPPARRETLEKAGLHTFPTADDRDLLKDLDAAERAQRYSVEWVDEARAMADVKAAVERGERVLWVVNVVDRCQGLVRRLREELGRDVLCYHSRFRLMDRQRMHAAVVNAFQARDAVVAVTTQVCEMSLDLDATVLVTELAPVPSLVQRFGRANRHLKRPRGHVLVYDPPNAAPYDVAQLRVARAFLNSVSSEAVSQRALADGLVEYSMDEARASDASRFVSGGYFATPGPLREIEERADMCVLDTDLDAVAQRLALGKPIDGYFVGVPRGQGVLLDVVRPAKLSKYVNIADGRRYDEHLGYVKGAPDGA